MISMKSNLKFAVFAIALLVSSLAGAMLAANNPASAATQSGNQTTMSKNMTSAGGMMANNATK